MSWDGYVNMLTEAGKIKNAAIFGHNGQQWATSAGFQVSVAQMTRVFDRL
jgi:hypothetical protein